jgi:THO complex subunit 2
MIDTVVESARYLSNLGWDVTMFMLLDALSDESKERVKSDGLTASAWLQGSSRNSQILPLVLIRRAFP